MICFALSEHRDSGWIHSDRHPWFATADDAFNCLRIEAGLPRFGVDITEGNLPQEVGRIENTISYTKGCYIGQETVARVRSFGHVNRMLRGLLLVGKQAVDPGTKVFHENEEVGAIVSSTFSPRLDRAIALAYVRRGHDAADDKLSVGKPNGEFRQKSPACRLWRSFLRRHDQGRAKHLTVR